MILPVLDENTLANGHSSMPPDAIPIPHVTVAALRANALTTPDHAAQTPSTGKNRLDDALISGVCTNIEPIRAVIAPVWTTNAAYKSATPWP